MSSDIIKTALKRSALFSHTDPNHLESILSVASINSFEKNEYVFMEGDAADAIYLVLSGRIRLFKTSLQGKEHVLHFAEEGEGFAEAALFTEGGYPADAQAVRNSKLVRIPRSTFMGILDSDIRFRDGVFRSMAKWLRRFADIIQSLTFRDVESRLASYIISQCKEEHGSGADDITITLGVEKSMLASYLGTIPETLSRALRRMQDNGLIDVKRSEITILDWQAILTSVSE